MPRPWSCVFISLLLMGLSLSAAAQESPKPDAQQSAAVLEVFPSTLELAPSGRIAEALLILRNPGTAALADIRITTFADADVEVKVEPAEALSLIPKGELAYRVMISTGSGDPTNGTAFFRVDYVQQVIASRVPKVAHAKLSFTSRDIAELAEVKVETTLASLDEHHPGHVYLVITNKSNQAILLSDLIPEGPAFIDFSKAWFEEKRQKGDLRFLPRQTRSIPVGVEAKGRVQPGRHLLVFTVEFQWDQKGAVQKRSAVVTQSVDVGVLGESAVLKLLGVPSFLLIPGFLAVATWGLLWNWGFLRSKKDTAKFPFSFDQPVVNLQFWVVAITVSVLIVLGYSRFNQGILRAYNLEDLVWLWLLSVFIVGVVGYSAIIGCRVLWRRWRTPAVTDTPVQILKKLGRQKLGTLIEQVEVELTQGGGARRAFLLQERSADRETSWVGPPISLRWEDGLTDEVRNLRAKVEEQLRPMGDPGIAAASLEKAQPSVAVQWKQPDENTIWIVGLREVQTASLNFLNADYIIVDEN
jgi:hypothetical protein